MSEAQSCTSRSANLTKWVALLGRRDAPTDGVEDYCTFLGTALASRGIDVKLARVEWMEKGWIAGLQQVWKNCSMWRGRWVLLQYTAFSWSHRGFPFGALAVLVILRRSGASVAVVFHEPDRQPGSGLLQALRGACQSWVIRRLYDGAGKAIFTVPLEGIVWLPKRQDKAAFIPLGANIPERVYHRVAPGLSAKQKCVIVFGVTDSSEAAAREVNDILSVMLEACKALGKLRLTVVGRGSVEARALLVNAFRGSGVEVVVRGVLPADEIAREFELADVLLFVRGAITPQRGSAMAGIASGIPVVGYRNGNIGGPLSEAGVEWSLWHDHEGLSRGLIRVLSDPQRWRELHERNLEVQKNYFSWSRIAERFLAVMGG